MPNNDWNKLGNDIRNIVQDAIETGDYGRLNRDLGVTLENALGQVANSVKDAAVNGVKGASGASRGQRTQQDRYGFEPDFTREAQKRKYEKKRMEEAREKFALYANTNTSRAVGILCTALGFSLFGMFGITTFALGIASLFAASLADKMVGILGIFVPAMIGSGVLAVYGNRLRGKVKRFRSYVHTLNGKTYAGIKELAKSVRKSEKFVRKDLKKMIDKHMFLEGHLDEGGTCLITSDESYEQYLNAKSAEESRRLSQEQEEKAVARAGMSEEAQKVIEQGNDYIEQIRRSNESIPGVDISNKMYHLENVIRRIFKRVEQHPELIGDLHKFMDYYLPTTVKLLKAYEELDKQPVEGDNIKTAKKEIENTLDTINVAFENLLDSFFKDTAWDVSTDISVLKTMLAQEGLTGGKDFQEKE
ncbi:MAG: 5-bromo-4-chloroindolyl phosphate hydrolysis family protein [Blautia sp.]